MSKQQSRNDNSLKKKEDAPPVQPLGNDQ